MDTTTLLLITTATFLIAGTIKGIAGIGMPTIALGLMTLAIEPRMAISITLFPLIVSNAWQFYRAGQIWAAIKRYRFFLVTMMTLIFFSTIFSAGASDRLIYGALGTVILIFVAVNVLGTPPELPEHHATKAQVILGGATGVFGGLAAIYAPGIAIYLSMRRVDKDEMVRATGLLVFAGSLPLLAGYLTQNLLSSRLALISALMVAPTLIGFQLGERVRAHLSQNAFRQVFFIVFFVLGLNLIRKALIE